MDKIVLKTFTLNSRKLSWQKAHDYLECEGTQECRDETEIYNYQRIQPSRDKFINATLRVSLTCPDCIVK